MLSVPFTEGMPEIPTAETTARRERSIRLAVLTSFVSKAGTILLQLLSIPLAVRGWAARNSDFTPRSISRSRLFRCYRLASARR